MIAFNITATNQNDIILILRGIAHSISLCILLGRTLGQLSLPELSLLILLDSRAAPTAAGEGEIGQACTLKMVFLADVGTLHEHRNPVETEAA
jgi:hypothetical protein